VIDGVGKAARFSYLHSNVIADPEGNAYQFDSDFLRRITPSGSVETLNPRGGSGDPAGSGVEPLASARFRLIMGAGMCFRRGRRDLCRRPLEPLHPKGRSADQDGHHCGRSGPGLRGWTRTQVRIPRFARPYRLDPYRKRFYTNGVDDWDFGPGKRPHEDDRGRRAKQ